MEKVELYIDGIKKEFTREDDRNGEHLFVAEDGSFVKFPAEGNLEEMIEEYNKANQKKVQVVKDVEYGKVETFNEEAANEEK